MDNATATTFLKLNGIRIFKVAVLVTRPITRGYKKGTTDILKKKEYYIVNDAETARAYYDQEVSDHRHLAYNSKDRALIRLFEPHIYKTGLVADYPDNAVITVYDTEEERRKAK